MRHTPYTVGLTETYHPTWPQRSDSRRVLRCDVVSSCSGRLRLNGGRRHLPAATVRPVLMWRDRSRETLTPGESVSTRTHKKRTSSEWLVLEAAPRFRLSIVCLCAGGQHRATLPTTMTL